MKRLFYFISILISSKLSAQYSEQNGIQSESLIAPIQEGGLPILGKTLYQHNRGAIVGIQRGAVTDIELGVEAHWRKLSLFNPNILGATANFNYNFGHNVIGYQAGFWMKHGRVNLTYGGNVMYYTNFHSLNQYGIGPAVGFRLAGFHLINGYNFLFGDKEFDGANTLYVTIRYYFPIENKFVWDKSTRQKKKERKKKKRKEDENGEKKGLFKFLKA